MPGTARELEQQLAEALATEAQLRALIDTLLEQGDAVFASRRWRLGSALLRPIEAVLRACGRALPRAQDAAHWRVLAGAQFDAIARRRALLQQLLEHGERDAETALAQLWRDVAAESVNADGNPARKRS
jgi:hypothetical protein